MLLVALSVAVQMVRAAPADAPTADDAVPTFAKNVAPILARNCIRCHRADGLASGASLVTYDEVSLKAHELRDKVSRREMPPWPADPTQSLPFRNDSRLSQQDIDTLLAWVDAGSPKGDDADLPPKPEQGLTKGWLHPDGRVPDAVVSLPLITVRANGTVPYIQRLIKVPYTSDRWISALEVRAGNPNLLHHMGITEVELPKGMTPEQMDTMDMVAAKIGAPSAKLQIQRVAVADPTNPGAYDMLGVYTPGTTFEAYGAGNGKLLKGGANMYINFNIHYTTTGREEHDESQLALWFEPNPPTNLLYRAPTAVDSIIANGRELLTDDIGTKAEGTPYALPPIPANGDRYELIGMTAYRQSITIYQLQPHAHVRARDFRYVVVYPDGRELPILNVPRYSYHFQLAYALATPLTLPAGSKVIVTAHYDNSPANEHLQHLGTNDAARRCGPANVAYFRQQNQSWDEMFTPLIQYSIGPEPGKRLKVVTAVGCLARSRDGDWTLADGSRPTETLQQGTSSKELAAASAIPLGHGRYRLLGSEPFDPIARLGQKVVVKGVLIAAHPYINVTSMQSTASRCAN